MREALKKVKIGKNRELTSRHVQLLSPGLIGNELDMAVKIVAKLPREAVLHVLVAADNFLDPLGPRS